MIRVTEIKFKLDEEVTQDSIKTKVAKKLRIKSDDIIDVTIVRESIDARKEIIRSYIVDVSTSLENRLISKGFQRAPEPYLPIYLEKALALEAYRDVQSFKSHVSPVVIGFGPAGLFAALVLAEAGLKPVIIEMGEPVEEREKTIQKFWEKGELNQKSNVQFGEGGAGTFSDGKLTTRVKDPRIQFVLDTFITAGAPEEIRYKQKPHMGTDYLTLIVKRLRERIIALGGTIHFSETFERFGFSGNDIVSVQLESGKVIEASDIVLATGHSARQTFERLYAQGVEMVSKPFAVGLRIEHPQALIDINQYGDKEVAEILGAADYKLTYKASNGRSVYSFCMCPGGEVIASASEEGHLVTNGMSYFKRDKPNANSALLVNVSPEDFNSDHPLAGIAFQRSLEKLAFEHGGRNYYAPCETVGSFLKIDSEKINPLDKMYENIETSYKPAVQNADLNALLPKAISDALKEAILYFGKKIEGFDHPKALLTGIESRSSSPVRILRDQTSFASVSYDNLYPCGEGAGYAGGITSSAIDGIKIAEKIILKRLES